MLIKDIDPNLISEVAVPIRQSAQIGKSSDDAVGTAGIAQAGVDATDVARNIGRAKGWVKPLEVVPAGLVNAGKPVASTLAKVSPFVGMVAGTADAVRRGAAGDYIGAGLALGTGIVSFVPGYGTAAALALLGTQMARDKSRTNKWIPDFDDLEKASAIKDGMQPGGNPVVFAAQNDLIKQGYNNITATGQMDQATEAALLSMAKKAKQNPSVWGQIKNAVGMNEDGEQLPTQDQIRDPAFCAAHGIETTWDSDTLDKDPEFVDKFMAARFWDKSTIVHNGKTYPVYQERDYDGDNPPRAMEESTELARIRLLTHKLLNG
jgi:hypothetical protein